MPDLAISAAKVAAILVKVRQYDVKDVVNRDDPVRSELASIIRGLNQDEQIDLVALAWLGRGDGDLADWKDIRTQAARAHNRRTAEYLLGMPLLSDYLEEALAQFGHSAEEFEEPL